MGVECSDSFQINWFVRWALLMMIALSVPTQASAEVRVQTTEEKRKTVTKPNLNIAKRCLKEVSIRIEIEGMP